MTVAVIDVGTNSTNLLVVDTAGNDIVRTVATTRLGDDLHATGRLSPGAIERTVAMVVSHAATARDAGATRLVVTGTAACRRAANTNDFVDAVHHATGLTVEILSERDEARFAFAGALSGLPEVLGPNLVVDIGGGSTEYTVGVLEAEMSASIPFGSVTSTASHTGSGRPKPEDLTNLIGAVSDELEEIGRTIPALATPARVIGVAGTIVTIAAVEIGLATFDASTLHGFVLTRGAAEDVFRTLATETLDERKLNPGLPVDRADIIVAGCCILVATMRRLQIDEIVVSTRSLLDGIATRERMTP
jgi:exopolyphosphatase / guanosine-5'-triphosphate,3'-diphosphate pyrophosphatase